MRNNDGVAPIKPRYDLICKAMCAVQVELESAMKQHPPFHSAHEGFAILKEEVDELWDEVKRDSMPVVMRAEAIQVAAMAIRFVIDVCEDVPHADRYR